MTPDVTAHLIEIAAVRYGFTSFKLRGGAMHGIDEMEATTAIRAHFPHARVTLNPDSTWSLSGAIALCKGQDHLLAYAEGPCGPEAGYLNREMMAEFEHATDIPATTNMIATD